MTAKSPVLIRFAIFWAAIAFPLCGVVVAGEGLDQAHTLYYQGSYEEAKDSYSQLDGDDAVAATIGLARCHRAVGALDDAVAVLTKAAKQHEKDARIPGLLAHIALDRGHPEQAEQWATKALQIDDSEVASRWVTAELHRLAGRMDEANVAYEWFIDFYNATAAEDFDGPETLHYVAWAAAQNARWNRVHDQFTFLVQSLYPEILNMQPGYWPARLESGMLFLEKFNEPEADTDFQAALEINDNAAEVHAAVARLALMKYELDDARKSVQRALEINPNLLVAHQLKADIEMANFEPRKAEVVLKHALTLCPTSESTLGRLAAVQGCLDGLVVPPTADSRMAQILAQISDRNAHAGEFFESLADSLDTLRRYPQSAHYFQHALTVMPQLVGAYGKLGMVQMRLGEEKKAKEQLTKAAEIDFENVRVDNSLKVLEVLETYETLETEHFLIRFDPAHDKIQARYIADYLERLYPDLCRQLGYEPKGKSLFEIFNKSGNTSGHGWFSARMVGLPHIHTIGACAGKMVGMVSPSAVEDKFNWARVVKHEFVHVINLQQTNFNIPHWFTEALAVYNEGYPRPHSWNAMLVRRMESGDVYDLSNINLGFIRPSNSDDWQMAYCQAELYAEYALERFGDDALAKLLAGYAENLSTEATIERAFEVSTEDFETGYREHLEKVVEKLPGAKQVKTVMSFAELVKAQEKDPENPDLLGDLAIGYLRRKDYPKARSLAVKALAAEPKHQGGTYVMVSLQMVIGDTAGAIDRLDEALDTDNPNPELLGLLAGLKYKAKQFDAAAELYELGRRNFPEDEAWITHLVRVHHKSGKSGKALPLLKEKALIDADDFKARKTLAETAMEGKQYEEAIRWSREALYINVLDIDMHRVLAEASLEREDHKTAIEEYEVAIEISPEQMQLRFALADACVQADQKDKAKTVLDKLLEMDPDYPGADVLRESLDK